MFRNIKKKMYTQPRKLFWKKKETQSLVKEPFNPCRDAKIQFRGWSPKSRCSKVIKTNWPCALLMAHPQSIFIIV